MLSGRELRRARPPHGWGLQGGLLSESELNLLMWVVGSEGVGPLSVLEVGHYYGLSTYAIASALAERGSPVHLRTVDAHVADKNVSTPAPYEHFVENMAALFDYPWVLPVHGMSQGISGPITHDVVFYDGDHWGEQERFTKVVIDSPSVKTFIFDDWDFKVPMECAKLLSDAGWTNEFSVNQRLVGDKENPSTMTLAIWRQPRG